MYILRRALNRKFIRERESEPAKNGSSIVKQIEQKRQNEDFKFGLNLRKISTSKEILV